MLVAGGTILARYRRVLLAAMPGAAAVAAMAGTLHATPLLMVRREMPLGLARRPGHIAGPLTEPLASNQPAGVRALWEPEAVFVYVDESFNDREFWVTGLIVPEEQAIALESALDIVVQEAADAYGVSAQAELHGNDLMNGKKDWRALEGKFRARFGVFLDALEAIAAIPDIRAFARGLDRKAHQLRYSTPLPPRELLIGYLAQRCHGLLARGETLALFVDESPKQAEIRALVREFKTHGTQSRFNGGPLRNILDTVYFAPSHESRLLQAADIVSYAHFRARTTLPTSKSYAAGQQARAVVKGLCNDHFWVP